MFGLGSGLYGLEGALIGPAFRYRQLRVDGDGGDPCAFLRGRGPDACGLAKSGITWEPRGKHRKKRMKMEPTEAFHSPLGVWPAGEKMPRRAQHDDGASRTYYRGRARRILRKRERVQLA